MEGPDGHLFMYKTRVENVPFFKVWYLWDDIYINVDKVKLNLQSPYLTWEDMGIQKLLLVDKLFSIRNIFSVYDKWYNFRL